MRTTGNRFILMTTVAVLVVGIAATVYGVSNSKDKTAQAAKQGSSKEETILCGVARRLINPKGATRIHDDLTATALYLNDGDNEAFLITFDLGGLRSKQFVDKIRAAIHKSTGVPTGHIFLTATHTHSAGATKETLFPLAAKLAKEAKEDAEECFLSYNFEQIRENLNRNLLFPNRKMVMVNHESHLSDASKEYVDTELGIVVFTRKGPKNAEHTYIDKGSRHHKAIITNYTAHPVHVGFYSNHGNYISADYPGYIRRTVEETFKDCLCLTTTGSTGNIHPLLPEGGFGAAEKMGKTLGQLTLGRAHDAVKVDYDTKLRLGYFDINLKKTDQATINILPSNAMRREKASELSSEDKELSTSYSLLGIGPILFVGVPGETLVELGFTLKKSSPFLRTFVLFYATDSIGYIPGASRYFWGGYEVKESRLAQGAGEFLVQEVLRSARDLVKQEPLRMTTID